MIEVPFVDLRAQHKLLGDELNQVIQRVMKSSLFILGRELEAFEQEFASYCGVAHCIGVGSGTEALHLSLKACNIGPGDEVITVSHTFIATVLSILYTGGTPVLVDIDPKTYTIDPKQVAEAITPRTKAILPVHLYGQCADMDPLLVLGQEHNIWVIEDACQAHGATYKGRKAGSIGHLGCFSFYPSKNIGACGDGGVITTDDEELSQRIRLLRNYGQKRKYEHESLGYNSRLDELQAAILRVKLRHLDDWNLARQEHAKRYTTLLSSSDVTCPDTCNWGHPVFHLFVIQDPKRDDLQKHLRQKGVETLIHYPIPVHVQPALRKRCIVRSALEMTEKASRAVLSLPIYPELTEEAIEHVSDLIKNRCT